MDFIVKKLGGENAAQLHNSAKNIYKDFVAGKSQAIVVSAMRSSDFNTTDQLINLGKELSNKNINEKTIFHIIKNIKNFHLKLLEDEMLCSKDKLIETVEDFFLEFKNNIKFFVKESIEGLNPLNLPQKRNDYSIELENGEKLSIIGFGEKISAKIISEVIDTMSLNGICSKSIDLGNIIGENDLKNRSRKQVFDMLTEKLSNIIIEKTKGGNIPILSGYIGSFPEGIEERVGRGYSDATAAISAVGLARKGYGVIIEIQKSVKGLLSADPRILKNSDDAVILKQVNYLTAREITGDSGAQAKLLHPQTLRSEVQEAGIKIHLFDPFSGEEGSWIVNENKQKHEKCSGITFIGGRRNVVFFSISSGKMFEKGILTRLFSIVDDYFSVDIVSTSETEVSFTIDGNGVSDKKLEEMTNKIKQEFNLLDSSTSEFVEYTKDRALIFCVGEHMRNYIGLMAKAVDVFGKNDINLKIVSQGRLQRAMIFGIEEKDLEKAINLLHKEFII